jgi:hypothetical protein
MMPLAASIGVWCSCREGGAQEDCYCSIAGRRARKHDARSKVIMYPVRPFARLYAPFTCAGIISKWVCLVLLRVLTICETIAQRQVLTVLTLDKGCPDGRLDF